MSLNIGLLEEMILLLILKEQETNGAEIVREYEQQLKKKISLPAVVVVLKRLEQKNILRSRMSESTAERGGRRKKLYRATEMGYNLALEIQEARNQIWNIIPEFKS